MTAVISTVGPWGGAGPARYLRVTVVNRGPSLPAGEKCHTREREEGDWRGTNTHTLKYSLTCTHRNRQSLHTHTQTLWNVTQVVQNGNWRTLSTGLALICWSTVGYWRERDKKEIEKLTDCWYFFLVLKDYRVETVFHKIRPKTSKISEENGGWPSSKQAQYFSCLLFFFIY